MVCSLTKVSYRLSKRGSRLQGNSSSVKSSINVQPVKDDCIDRSVILGSVPGSENLFLAGQILFKKMCRFLCSGTGAAVFSSDTLAEELLSPLRIALTGAMQLASQS